MKLFFIYLRRTFILEIKKTLAYPAMFWVVVLTIPLYSVIRIAFLETIFSQTNNFVGYTKYEGYVLFGTFTLVQTLGHLFLYNRLAEMKGLIRGGAQESFDTALTKPIDPQIYTTVGRYNFGNIAPFFIGILTILYGLFHEPHLLTVFNLPVYLILVTMGVLIFYLLFLFFSIFLFWFPELQMTEGIWETFQTFGQFPTGMYRGTAGVIFNIILPLTLMASIPADVLLGKKDPLIVFIYIMIAFLLFLLIRAFWNIALTKYSSSSS